MRAPIAGVAAALLVVGSAPAQAQKKPNSKDPNNQQFTLTYGSSAFRTADGARALEP
jgi:hypothetical protein